MRNFSDSDGEVPIYGKWKLSTTIYILVFAGAPGILLWNSVNTQSGVLQTILYLILTIVLGTVGYVFSEWKIDGRNFVLYYFHSLRKKIVKNNTLSTKIQQFDITPFLDKIKEDA